MRYVELFAGAGGLSRGLDAAGLTCAAHAEIEPHARAVLRRHWPDTPLYGDVTAVDWTAHRGVELVSGGSPCQDLSVAGKRAGLDGARSGLFFELIRAWNDTGAPYCLWENVDGARSSNAGADFAAVLSAFVGGTVPVTGRWGSAGVVAGPTGVAAWRVLDLQHFGPPQRRRRVFVLAARAGGCDPAEILALSEGVCGHPAPRERQRQDAPRGAAGSAGSGAAINISNGEPRVADVFGTLQARAQAGGIGSGAQMNAVLAFHPTQDPISGTVSPALGFNWQNGGGYGAANDGLGITVEDTGPLSKSQVCAVVAPVVGVDLAPTLDARDAKGPGNFHNGSLRATVFPAGRPRRLTPLECERLQSWPDQWTATGTRDDGATYALSDTARYRLAGNGVGSVVAEWIGRRLLWAEAHTPAETASCTTVGRT